MDFLFAITLFKIITFISLNIVFLQLSGLFLVTFFRSKLGTRSICSFIFKIPYGRIKANSILKYFKVKASLVLSQFLAYVACGGGSSQK